MCLLGFTSGTILEVPLSEVSVDEVLTKLNPLGRFQQCVLLIILCGSAPIVGLQVGNSLRPNFRIV